MRRNRRKKRIIRLSILAVLLAVVLAVLFLFQVRKVTVYGNNRNSSQEISDGLMHSLLTKNTLYLQWEYRKGKVPDTLPYLSSLNVKMKSPFEIEVQVTEKELAGYVDKGSHAYFDQEGVVLEITDETYADLPVITGAEIEEPVIYQKLPTMSSAQLRTILSVTHLLDYQELNAQEIRFDENGDITVYIDGVEAMLGQDEYMEEKIANLRAILEKTDGEKGTLHLESFTGKNDTVTFRASDETEPETGNDASGDGASGADSTAAGSGAEGTGEDGTGDAEGTGADSTVSDDASGADSAAQNGDSADSQEEPEASSNTIAMVFNSSGTLVYNVHIENGTVVDANGNPVPGCSVNENGYVVDAYMNVIDPATGELVQ